MKLEGIKTKLFFCLNMECYLQNLSWVQLHAHRKTDYLIGILPNNCAFVSDRQTCVTSVINFQPVKDH
jgi:hypothetical protein